MKKKPIYQTGAINFFLFFIFSGVAVLFLIGYIIVNYKHVGKPCGGFAANLPEYQCPVGLRCVSEASYPDVSGNCQYVWPISLIINRSQPIYNSESENTNNELEEETNPEGQFCGGIANIACPEGYECKLDGKYPDAGGKCIKL